MNNGLANPNFRDGKCPHCSIYRQWQWNNFINNFNVSGYSTYCNVCQNYIIYFNEKIIYPKTNLLIKPNILFDNYQKSKKLFLEAVEVAPISPRAGLTLSRMCLEALTNEILEENKEKVDKDFKNNIDKLHELDIINSKLKTFLTSTRIIGNKSTHNFNIIDTDNEPDLKDAIVVLETIDYILENMRIAKDKEEKLSNLEKKIKGEPVNNSFNDEVPF